MFALILRPFGQKHDRVTQAVIDFDRVQAELIEPALRAAGLTWGSSGDSSPDNQDEARLDALLSADLILADVSFESASVFYELGLAHALRDKRTLLMGARSASRRIFDLTQRVCTYEATDPSAALPELTAMLRASMQSDAVDSPVYALIPGLQPPRPPAVPEGFGAEVVRALAQRDAGHLRLLSQEARRFNWRVAALGQLGTAQRGAGDLEGARETLEHLLSLQPTDTDAALSLGTIYQRLRDYRRSDELIQRTLTSLDEGSEARTEALALLGRSAKASWLDDWQSCPEPERRTRALASVHLRHAYDHYLQAFKSDLNRYYPGLLALSLGWITLDLAQSLPEVWADLFDDDAQAELRQTILKKEVDSLIVGVGFTLGSAAERPMSFGVWGELARAEFELLVSNRPNRVAERFRQALGKGEPYVADAALSQIRIYEALAVRPDHVRAALDVLQQASSSQPPLGPAHPALWMPRATRALLFVGHGIDEPGRASPRFPRSGEAAAQAAIRDAVAQTVRQEPQAVLGIAGASSGGDILFHEVCASLGVESLVCLAVPAPDYERFGVIGAGAEWESRFREVLARHRSRVLAQSTALPHWLRRQAPYEFWGRDAAWRYHTAAAIGHITVIALWDGKAGATADLVGTARAQGAEIIVLDTVQLFGASAAAV